MTSVDTARLNPGVAKVESSSPEADANIYGDGTYLKNNPGWHQEDSAWKTSLVLEMLQRHKMQPASVAEIGCGAGAILCELIRKLPGANGVGYEVSPQAYAICSRKAGGRLDFRLRDLLGTDDFFDLVMAMDVFEHVEDYIGFLRKLRKHGKAHIFHIPLDMSALNVLRGTPLRKVREEVGHLHYFSKDTALRTLETAGYTVQDWFYGRAMLNGLEARKRLRARIAYLPRRIALALNEDLAVRVLGGCSLLALCR